MAAGRQRLVTVVVILVLSVPLVVLAVSSGGDSDGADNALRVELASVPPPNGEVVIYIRDEADNTPSGAEGTAVRLECLDKEGKVVVSGAYPWPVKRDPSEPFGPHIHQPLPKGGLRQVVSCRLAGTKGPLAGRAKPAEL